MKYILSLILICFLSSYAYSQNVIIDGYTFETGNRGYIANAKVTVKSGDKVLKTSIADNEGHFVITVPEKSDYTLEVTADLYEDLIMQVSGSSKNSEGKIFTKVQMKRLPGYLFEVTLADSRKDENVVVDAIQGARIDVFNNTTFEEVFVLYDHPDPQFQVPLFKGNHYTVLVRKEGYIAKRIEAFVDVEGCILCFEGLGTITPGVADNLSRGNQIGVLLANVSLEKVFSGKTIVLKDLYYDFAKAFLKPGAKKELDKLVLLMNDNPEIKVELGAHTDSRGAADKNQTLSQRRAQNAVNYLVKKGIAEERIIAYGYGETQLRNECKDGVQCTETEHAYNRRTELKILDVAKTEERVKSLAELKMLEKGEKELADFAFSGVVEVKDDETLEEAQEAKEAMDKVIESEVKPLEIEEEVVEASAVNSDKVSSEMTDKDLIFYKIIIHSSAEPLSKTDKLYTTHSDLIEVKTDNEYKYLVGNFEGLKEVSNYLNTTIKMVYPKAQIVKFKDGQIIK